MIPTFLGDGFQVPMPTLGDTARARAVNGGAGLRLHALLAGHGSRPPDGDADGQ